MEERKIEYVSIDKLVPYENNPRINDDAVEPVAASIKMAGFKVPIIVDAAMTIIAGHTRYKAAQQLGLKEVPVNIADDLSSEQAQAYRLVDNKTQELAKWDYDKLDDEMSWIHDVQLPGGEYASLDSELVIINMADFGFGGDEEGGDSVIRVQDIDDSEEIDLDDFEDENFNCECPVCGFRFNEG